MMIPKLTAFHGHNGSVLAVAIINGLTNNFIVSAGEESAIRIWDIRGNLVQTISVSVSSICALGILNDGQGSLSIITGSSNGLLQIFDMSSGELIISLRHRGLRALVVSDDQKLVISGGMEGCITIRNHQTGAVVGAGGMSDIFALSVSSGDHPKIASGGNEKMINIWDAISGEHCAILETIGPVYAITFLLDNPPMVCAGGRDRIIRGWSIDTYEQHLTLTGHEGVILALKAVTNFDKSPHPYLISASADKTVRIWDIQTRSVLHILRGHSGAVTCLAVSNVSSKILLVSGSFDGTVLLWNLNLYLNDNSSNSNLLGYNE